MYARGMSLRAIAAQTSLTVTAVRDRLMAAGVTMRSVGRQPTYKERVILGLSVDAVTALDRRRKEIPRSEFVERLLMSTKQASKSPDELA